MPDRRPPPVHFLEREIANTQRQREGIEHDLADGRAVMEFFLDQSRQLALGDPRREQEPDQRVGEREHKRDRDNVAAAQDTPASFRFGLHSQGTCFLNLDRKRPWPPRGVIACLYFV